MIGSADLPLAATKTFDPALIPVGGSSTVTLGATNTSTRVLDSLTITEPGAGQVNPFTEGLTFDGWGAVQWPAGATGASVVWTLADGSTVTAVAAAPGTLPDPPAGVVGFAVTFTGPIVAGAEASIAFDVLADTEQAVEELTHTNIIDAASTAPGGFQGQAQAQDDLTVLQERLAVAVAKTISPAEILSVPGEPATVQLTGTVQDFPASTTDAHRIVVTDPADLTTDTWWDAFEARAVAATPIPAQATLTVQYFDGTQWIDVPGMVALAGPQVYSGALPAEVVANAQGLRFVYDSEAGFAPGTQVKPNLSFALRPELADSALEIENCAAADASADAIAADQAVQAPCPTIQLVPPTPGTGDLLEKDWDAPKLIGERTADDAGLTLRWSTAGRSFLDRVLLTDVPDPGVAASPTTVFDFFDLVRIDPITAAQDPLLVWDRVESVELFRSGEGWVRAAADPCPAACDGTFPGVALSAAERADTLSFRLVFQESPTRGARSGQDPTAPPVGSGVARSTSNNRTLHPVFRIRDELRSDPEVPVTADRIQNVTGQTGEVRNTARVDAVIGDDIVLSDTDSDIIALASVPVTVDVLKSWTGGPLGLPPAGTAAADRPSGIVSVTAINTTPRRIDELVITEAVDGTTPFDAFDLTGFAALTVPATVGADTVTVVVALADGGTLTLDRAGALAATAEDLAEAVGFTITYAGRILEGARATVRFGTRLREITRGGVPVAAGLTVDNTVGVVGSDLVGYPGVDPVTHSDTASDDIAVVAPGIDVAATKQFELEAQVEPDRGPLALTLAATPAGPSRTNRMEIEEADPRFWNQYAFVDFGDFDLTAPIQQVRVDALIGGSFTAVGATLEYTGGSWVPGTAAATPALPAGVSADQVQGLRFVYTRADNSIWENPSTPSQEVELSVQRRLELVSGGPVLTDLVGDPGGAG